MGRVRRVRLVVALGGVSAMLAAAWTAPAQAQAPGWTQRALDLQYELASDVGFANAPWVGTHNSFNSIAEMGIALSVLDSNQRIDLAAQLDAGVRSLELDVHKFLTTVDGVGFRPVVCHARPASEGHFGCSVEKPLRAVLREIAAWLRAPGHGRQVLLLYLEDHLQDAEGFAAGAQVIHDELAGLVYEPPPGGCSEVPPTLTRDQVRAESRQVVIVSDCGVGPEWPSVAFNWDSHVESRPRSYQDYPNCGPDYDRAIYESRLVRYYEDSTHLTNTVGPPTGIAQPDDGITPATAAAMARCGVDLVGLDQLTGPADPRLAALVWSWAPNRPRPAVDAPDARCSLQRPGRAIGRAAWYDVACERRARPACRDDGGAWRILTRTRPWPTARAACERRGASLGLPRTGFDAQLLAAAAAAADARAVWLGQRRYGNRWHPTDGG